MADAYQALQSLRAKLTAEREVYKEKLARGQFTDADGYRELVGRCKALAAACEDIGKQIKSINGDEPSAEI